MFLRLIGALDRLTIAISLANHTGKLFMSALDNLTAAVAKDASIEASAVTLINGLADQIKAAAAQNDTAAVQALADQITSSSSALAAAISANTPAAPAPVADAPVAAPTGATGA